MDRLGAVVAREASQSDADRPFVLFERFALLDGLLAVIGSAPGGCTHRRG